MWQVRNQVTRLSPPRLLSPLLSLEEGSRLRPDTEKQTGQDEYRQRRRRRYRARLNRLRFERDRLLVFFKSPRRYQFMASRCRERKPTKLTGL